MRLGRGDVIAYGSKERPRVVLWGPKDGGNRVEFLKLQTTEQYRHSGRTLCAFHDLRNRASIRRFNLDEAPLEERNALEEILQAENNHE